MAKESRLGPYLGWGQVPGLWNVIYRKVVIWVIVEVIARMGVRASLEDIAQKGGEQKLRGERLSMEVG